MKLYIDYSWWKSYQQKEEPYIPISLYSTLQIEYHLWNNNEGKNPFVLVGKRFQVFQDGTPNLNLEKICEEDFDELKSLADFSKVAIDFCTRDNI